MYSPAGSYPPYSRVAQRVLTLPYFQVCTCVRKVREFLSASQLQRQRSGGAGRKTQKQQPRGSNTRGLLQGGAHAPPKEYSHNLFHLIYTEMLANMTGNPNFMLNPLTLASW